MRLNQICVALNRRRRQMTGGWSFHPLVKKTLDRDGIVPTGLLAFCHKTSQLLIRDARTPFNCLVKVLVLSSYRVFPGGRMQSPQSGVDLFLVSRHYVIFM